MLGRGAVLSDPEELLVYESDGLTLFRALADFVVFPTSAEHVSAIVKLANREGLPFVARGAGTGLSGGCLPAEGGIVISLMRMNRVLEVDYENQIAVVEPGLVNLHLSWAVGPRGYYYAPDPSSQQACTIGGNIANNSGGPHTLKYGVTTNHVLGLEVVMPDGEIVWLGGKTRESFGYDLAGVFVGSEGTFGVATKICVRILKKPQAVKTVLGVFDRVEQASAAVSAIIARSSMASPSAWTRRSPTSWRRVATPAPARCAPRVTRPSGSCSGRAGSRPSAPTAACRPPTW